jgi:hypothetical protein
VAVYEVGEEKPNGLTKTLHGRGDPRLRRRHGDSLGRRCAGTAKMTAYITLRSEVGSVAVEARVGAVA